MAETISQCVNALFASYVAVEDEQERLSSLGTPEGAEQANALGEAALAIHDEVFAIRDRSGCVDLVAARILLSLMMAHPWPPEPDIEWGEDAEVALPMLEILADRVTGAVRVETRRALATIGVDVPAEEADEFVALFQRERSFQAAYAAAAGIEDEDAFHRENDGEAGQILCADPPPITTPAGLRAAIAYVAEDVGYAQAAHVRILNRALAYLDGRA